MWKLEHLALVTCQSLTQLWTFLKYDDRKYSMICPMTDEIHSTIWVTLSFRVVDISGYFAWPLPMYTMHEQKLLDLGADDESDG